MGHSILQIDDQISFFDTLLIFLTVTSAIGFWRFIGRNSKAGFLIKEDSIFLLNGRILCNLSEIKEIDTSQYSFKSTNGFIIRLKENSHFDWSPGLFWKFKSRISIGGLITKSESKWLSTELTRLLTIDTQD